MASNGADARPPGVLTYSFATPHRRVGEILYVNAVTKYKCANSCRFCSRTDAIKGLPNIYEKKAGANLYLPKAPLPEDIVREVGEKRKQYPVQQIAFVGLGEPLLDFELVRDSIRGIRSSGYTGRIALDTNGLVNCWYDLRNYYLPAKDLKKAGLDEIRISVNAINDEDYNELCRPRYDQAFGALLVFVYDCISNGIDTFASFVVGFSDGVVKTRTKEEYAEFASSRGIKPENVIIREYVAPLIEK
ncbi:MAG: radical SAM protein [Candidatus ainarchaeum sp.]|nr:radical SAM protein [Candidatus ainarchaeum sp.]